MLTQRDVAVPDDGTCGVERETKIQSPVLKNYLAFRGGDDEAFDHAGLSEHRAPRGRTGHMSVELAWPPVSPP